MKELTCYCYAYPFPHRAGSGECNDDSFWDKATANPDTCPDDCPFYTVVRGGHWEPDTWDCNAAVANESPDKCWKHDLIRKERKNGKAK